MQVVLILCGGLCVVLGGAAHLYVRLRMRPPEDLDGYDSEFEDQHPDYARYTRWLQWTLGVSAVGVLLLFLAMVV
jgi:hypothetical protein